MRNCGQGLHGLLTYRKVAGRLFVISRSPVQARRPTTPRDRWSSGGVTHRKRLRGVNPIRDGRRIVTYERDGKFCERLGGCETTLSTNRHAKQWRIRV